MRRLMLGAALAACLAGAPAYAQTSGAGSNGTNTVSVQIPGTSPAPITICAKACNLFAVFVQNASTTNAFLKAYPGPASAVTCGSGTPTDRWMIPANGAVIPIGGNLGAQWPFGLVVCPTANFADSDATAVAASTFQASFYVR